METNSSKKNNLIQDSEGNEENGYPVPYFNKTKINYMKEPSDAHKNTLKGEIFQEITENFHEENTRHDYSKCTKCTQEIATHQK
jgi:hypothetical protein